MISIQERDYYFILEMEDILEVWGELSRPGMTKTVMFMNIKHSIPEFKS